MVVFEPYGPYEIPVEKLPSSKLIAEDLSPFWKARQKIASGVGCYIFGIRTGRAVIPYYVGMTTASFESEKAEGQVFHRCINERRGRSSIIATMRGEA